MPLTIADRLFEAIAAAAQRVRDVFAEVDRPATADTVAAPLPTDFYFDIFA
jgi:hypothetical protein